MSSGTVALISSSIELTPSAASIWAFSAAGGPIWRPTKAFLPSRSTSGVQWSCAVTATPPNGGLWGKTKVQAITKQSHSVASKASMAVELRQMWVAIHEPILPVWIRP